MTEATTPAISSRLEIVERPNAIAAASGTAGWVRIVGKIAGRR